MPVRNLPSPLTVYPEIEIFRLGVEILNFREKGWEKRVALGIKVVHLAEIYKKGLLLRISKRFAGEVREPVGNGSPRENEKSRRRFTFLEFFSETREDTLKSLMVNLVCLAKIYKKVHEHFPRTSNRFAGKARKRAGSLLFPSQMTFPEKKNAKNAPFFSGPLHREWCDQQMPVWNSPSPPYHLGGNQKIHTGSGNLKFSEEGLGWVKRVALVLLP